MTLTLALQLRFHELAMYVPPWNSMISGNGNATFQGIFRQHWNDIIVIIIASCRRLCQKLRDNVFMSRNRGAMKWCIAIGGTWPCTKILIVLNNKPAYL